jgi:hypothetical protein
MRKTKQPQGGGRRVEQMPMMPGFIRGALAEVMGVVRDPGTPFTEQELPASVQASVMEWTMDMLRFCKARSEGLGGLNRKQWTEIGAMVTYAAEAGFAMALYRYAQELKRVPELTDWQSKRDAGLNKGRHGSIEKSRQRAQRIRDAWHDMEAAGEKPTNEKVASVVGCSVSTVVRAFRPT